jgi:hypothetical protein
VSKCVWFALSKGRVPRRQSVVVGRGDGQQRSQSAQSPKRPYRLAPSTSLNKAMLCLKTNETSFRRPVRFCHSITIRKVSQLTFLLYKKATVSSSRHD